MAVSSVSLGPGEWAHEIADEMTVDTREIMPLNEAQIRKECQILKEKGITDIAVIGVFSPLDIAGKQEARVREIILEEMPEADVVLSRESKSDCQRSITPVDADIQGSWPVGVSRERKCHHSQHINSQVC